MEHIQGKVTPFRQAYLRWRSLRNVPFRKKFFIGYDLDGNTYWEFHNDNNPLRPRRIVEYRENKGNWVDYKMPPQWMQWLRFTRPHYPTLQELYADKVRQEILKLKVKAAEERWKSIPLKKEGSGQASAHDVLNRYKAQAELQGNEDVMVNKSAEDLTPAERAAIEQQQQQQQQQQPPSQQAEPEQNASEDKHAHPPKPIVQANPSEAFAPGTWAHKPASRG